jgi:hypothetical protein
MQRSLYAPVSATVFAVVALAHAYRAVMAIPAEVGGAAVPVWASWAALAIGGALSVWGFRSRG